MLFARPLALVAPLLFLVSAAHADTYNGVGSDWFSASNWSALGTDGPPTSTEDAIFPDNRLGLQLSVTNVQLSASTTILNLFVESPLDKQYAFTGANGAVLTATSFMTFVNTDRQALNVHTVTSLRLNTPQVEVRHNAILALNNATVTTDSIGTTADGRIDVNSGSSVQTRSYFFDQSTGELRVNSGGELRIFGDTTLVRGLTRVNSGGQLNAQSGVNLEYNGPAQLQFADSHAVDDGVHLKATVGGDISAGSFIDVGNNVTGSLTVHGTGSTLTAGGSQRSDWGTGSSGNATVTISVGGVATVSSLVAGFSDGAFVGNVTSGGTLRTTSTFRMGGGTRNRTVSLTVNGGTLQTDGLATFDVLADLNLVSGTVSFNGGATFNAGSRFDWSGGVANLGAGQTLLVDGGVVNRTSTAGFSFGGGSTTRIRNGGVFNTPSFFDLGTATLDMTGGALNVGTTGGTVSDWGAATTTTATIANNSVATYNSGLRMSVGGGTTSATVSSNARLVANGFLSTGGNASSVVTLNVSGGRVDSDGPVSFLRGTTATVSAGGVVEGQDVVLGSSGGTTTTTVTGANSLLKARGTLTVGTAGAAQLNVDAGGFASAVGGVSIGSQGRVSLTTGVLETAAGQSVVSSGILDAISGSEIRADVVNAGRLTVVGSSLTHAVTLQPGSSSTVDDATFSSLTHQAGADIDFQLREASNFDDLTVTGAASLAGDFVVSLGSGTTLTAGMTFPIFTAGSISGTPFVDFSAAPLPIGLGWIVNSTPTSITLTVGISAPVLLAGDYNDDGFVDAADYTVWRDNVGAAAGTLPNDPAGGVIGNAQYTQWDENYGADNNQAQANSTSVPEPSAAALLLALASIATLRRRNVAN